MSRLIPPRPSQVPFEQMKTVQVRIHRIKDDMSEGWTPEARAKSREGAKALRKAERRG